LAEPHARRGFQEEFIEFLERHHMQFAPARIWK
jgi:hypothetical protein